MTAEQRVRVASEISVPPPAADTIKETDDPDSSRRVIKADLAILLASLLWGGEYNVVKYVIDVLPPHYINTVRFLLSFLILSLVFVRRIQKTTGYDLKAGFVCGFFLFAGFAAETIGIQYTTASKSGFLTATYVVIVPFIVWLVHRRFPGMRIMISTFMCILGIYLLTSADISNLGVGDTLTLFSAFWFACCIIAIDHFSKRMDPVLLTVLELAFAGLFSLVAMLVTREPPPALTGSALVSLGYLVFLGTIACHLLSNIAQRYTYSTHASIIFSLEAVFSLVFAVIFLGETFTRMMGLGFGLIFLALILTEVEFKVLVKIK
jgi:drug/metabolite transporter (DMT)-like permease